MSAFGDLGTDDPLRIWDGVVAWTIQGERETLALIELEPRTVVPEHAHENEQVGVLLRGSPTFRIDGEGTERRAGGGGGAGGGLGPPSPGPARRRHGPGRRNARRGVRARSRRLECARA